MAVRKTIPACLVFAALVTGGCATTKIGSPAVFCELTTAHIQAGAGVTIEANAMLTPNYDILLQRPECPKSGALLFIPEALSGDASVKRLTSELAPTWSSGQHLKILFEGSFRPAKELGEPNAFVLRKVLSISNFGD